METNDITVHILREIRDSIVDTKSELVAEVRATNQRLDSTNERLDRLTDSTNTRFEQLGNVVSGLSGTLVEVRDLLEGRRDIRHRVERCERDIAELKRRVP